MPDAVVLSHPIDGETGLIEAVRNLRGKTLSLHLRVRAMRAKWLALAQEAAAQNLKMRAASSASALRKLQALQNAIGLAELPNRMGVLTSATAPAKPPAPPVWSFWKAAPTKTDLPPLQHRRHHPRR